MRLETARLLLRRWGSRALVDAAFAELGATRVYAQTMAVKIASRRVMEWEADQLRTGRAAT